MPPGKGPVPEQAGTKLDPPSRRTWVAVLGRWQCWLSESEGTPGIPWKCLPQYGTPEGGLMKLCPSP